MEDKPYKIINGNSLDVLDTLEENSITSIITDPPYELGFMGKGWDKSGIAYNVELWKKALRVLKPGGFLLAFGGSRTYHRIACAIEDAGFEIRDTIMWLYGSGSTGKAVMFENRERNANYTYVGIELDPEYCQISEARIDYALNQYKYDLLEEIEELHDKGEYSLFDFIDEEDK